MNLMKYHNGFNSLKLKDLTEKEIDILFSFMFKAKDKGIDEISISYSELSKLLNQEDNKDRLPAHIVSLGIKLKALNQMVRKPNGDIVLFGLFDKITIKVSEKVVVVKVNEEFQYMLNDLLGNFTLLDLRELVSLKGNYAKTLFRLLKQWESKKEYIVNLEEFRELMGIPSGYEQRNIDQKILNPCLEQLEKFFTSLKIEKLKKGVKIDEFKFTWKSKPRIDTPKSTSAIIQKSSGLTAEDWKNLYPEQTEINQEIKSQMSVESPTEIVEEVPIITLTEEEEERALKELGNEAFFREMKRKTERVYWLTLRGILNKI